MSKSDDNERKISISNYEINSLIKEIFKERLSEISIQRKVLSDLSNAVMNEDFDMLCNKIAKAVLGLIRSKKKNKPSMVEYIHGVISKLSDCLDEKASDKHDFNSITQLKAAN